MLISVNLVNAFSIIHQTKLVRWKLHSNINRFVILAK
jgi:hypothetical protein